MLYCRFLHDLYDRKSRRFHHFLTQQEIANRFGPSRADYDAVLHLMTSRGFSLERGSENRPTLTMSGTRADAERAFDLKIADYRINKTSFFANDRDPSLPSSLAVHIEDIAGLSTLDEPRPAVEAIATGFATVVCSLATVDCTDVSAAQKQSVIQRCVTTLKNLGSAGLFDLNLTCTTPPPPPPPSPTPTITPLGLGFATPAPEAHSLALHSAAVQSAAIHSATIATPPFSGAGQTIGLAEFDTYETADSQ